MPQPFRTGDRWLTFNLATNLAQMQPGATVRNQNADLTAALLTLAGAMSTVPVIVLIPAKLITGDVPGLMFKADLWSMAHSLMVAAAGVFTCWVKGKKRR